MKRNKKNAQGAGTIRKRSDGRWEARFTIGFDPVNGKQKQKSIYGKTQKEVREKLAQVTVEIDEGTYIEPCQMTLEEWMTIWLAEYMGDKKWSTIKHYKAQVKSHILPALGHYPLSQLNPHIIQAFDNALLRGTGKEKPLTPKSVRNVHGVLRKCLAVAVQLEYIRRNPAEPVILPRVEKKIIKPLTDEEVQKMICAAGDDGFGTLFKVVVFTGLRLGEALGLTWDCVDFTKRRLTIDKQLQKRPIADGGFVFASLKNDKVRVVAPAPYVLDLLKEWEQRQKEWRLKCGPEWQGWKMKKSGGPLLYSPMSSVGICIPRPYTITSRSWQHLSALPMPGCTTCVIPTPSCRSKTEMMSKRCREIWDMRQRPSRWMSMVMFRNV